MESERFLLRSAASNLGPGSLEKPDSFVKHPLSLLEQEISIRSVPRAAPEFLGPFTLSGTLFSRFSPAAVGLGTLWGVWVQALLTAMSLSFPLSGCSSAQGA